MDKKIHTRVKNQMEKAQKEYYLNEKMKAIQQELGRKEERVNEINELFCDPTFFTKTPPKQVNKLEREQADLKTQVEEMITAWETVETELEES